MLSEPLSRIQNARMSNQSVGHITLRMKCDFSVLKPVLLEKVLKLEIALVHYTLNGFKMPFESLILYQLHKHPKFGRCADVCIDYFCQYFKVKFSFLLSEITSYKYVWLLSLYGSSVLSGNGITLWSSFRFHGNRSNIFLLLNVKLYDVAVCKVKM